MSVNRQMLMSIVVKLVERVSAPLDRIMSKIRGLSAVTDRIGRLTGRIGDLGRRIGALGTLGAALSFVGPLQAAAAFDAALRDLAITSGTTSSFVQDDVAGLAKSYDRLALLVGQRSMKIAEASQILIAAGLDRKVVETLLPQVGRATTAAGAEIADIAKMTVALNQNLKISADQMEGVFAGLVVAGKEGRFELRDMARAFPVLTGHLANLGVTGAEAAAHIGAALQIAMRGAAEPAQAATNVENFLSKLLSKETIKNFEKKGVDITATMEEAVWKGINPIEAALKKILHLTGMTTAEIGKLQARAAKGGITDPAEIAALSARIRAIRGGGEIAQMFGDMQVKNFLIPMLAGVADFKAIKDKIVTAMRGDPQAGVLADDFRSRMAGLEKRMGRFAEVGEQSMRRIGRAFATHLAPVNGGMERLLKSVAAIDVRFPGVIDTTLAWGGAALLAVAAVGLLGKAISFVTTGIAFLAGLVGWPALVAAGIAAAAVAIYAYWDQIKTYFQESWTAIREGWADLVAGISAWWSGLWANLQADFRGFAEWMSRRWKEAVPGWLQAVVGGAVQALWTGIKSGADTFGGWWDALIQRFLVACAGLVGPLGAAMAAAVAVILRHWEPIKAFFEELWGGIQARFEVFGARLVGPLGAAMAAVVAVISWHWEPVETFLERLWSGIQARFEAFGAWLKGWLVGRLLAALAGLVGPLGAAMAAAVAVISRRWEPVKAFFEGLWGGIQARFEAFGGWLKSWWETLVLPEWVRRVLSGGPVIPFSAPAAAAPAAAPDGGPAIPSSAPAAAAPALTPGRNGFAPVGSAAGRGRFAEQKVGGRIVVEVQGPGKVKSIETDNRDVPLTVDRGLMLGLP